MTALVFVVPGPPVPKGRPRVVVGADGRSRTTTPKRTRAYEDHVGWAFREAHPGGVPFPAGVAVAVTLDIHEGRVRPQHQADIDNVEKAVLDALNGLAWDDDKQVVEKHTHLRRGQSEPRVEVVLSEVPDAS